MIMQVPNMPKIPKSNNSYTPNTDYSYSSDPLNSPSPAMVLFIVAGVFSAFFSMISFMAAFEDVDKSFGSRFSSFFISLVLGGISIYSFYSCHRLIKKEKERRQELEDREYELRKAQIAGSFSNEDTVSSDEVISPYFTDYQKNLKKQRQNLVNKYDGVTRLIDSLFSRGTLTSERYSASIKKAYKTGISAAKKGADLCDALKGEDLPNDSSRNVLDHYMDLTKQMADLIENQIVVLAGLDLDRSEKIQTSLNEQISEINSTIHMYE